MKLHPETSRLYCRLTPDRSGRRCMPPLLSLTLCRQKDAAVMRRAESETW